MFEYWPEGARIPVKIWLDREEYFADPELVRQTENLAKLPFAYKHIVICPDAHPGFGMPIGGVLAAEGQIVPNAVGVDIGCGMGFVHTNIPARLLTEVTTPTGTLAQAIVGQIMRAIPVGFDHHRQKQPSRCLDELAAAEWLSRSPGTLLAEIERAYYQIGTLGGGNHFIELQEDEAGKLAIMVHSGSRNFGYKICNYYNNLAKKLNEKWRSPVPKEWQLAHLPVDSEEGQTYINWMTTALNFARENRQQMMAKVKEIVFEMVAKHFAEAITVDLEVNAHHNYAALEEHFGKKLWIHRKGAIRARRGEYGIIPGAMGSHSYIVEGLGNPDSFSTCSHGAGRKMGRQEAKRVYRMEEVLKDLKSRGVVLGKNQKSDVAEECVWAYKDIDTVINNELDLIKPIMKLKTIAVVKG
ncbi:MAG: RtcB family protein [Firmicutes bacterium]|nr:RtcB family protein [Bacillota bacterium]